MKPVQQVFALVLENMSGFKKKYGYTLRRWKIQTENLKKKYPDKYDKKLETLKNKEVKVGIFLCDTCIYYGIFAFAMGTSVGIGVVRCHLQRI